MQVSARLFGRPWLGENLLGHRGWRSPVSVKCVRITHEIAFQSHGENVVMAEGLSYLYMVLGCTLSVSRDAVFDFGTTSDKALVI